MNRVKVDKQTRAPGISLGTSTRKVVFENFILQKYSYKFRLAERQGSSAIKTNFARNFSANVHGIIGMEESR